MFLIPPPPCNFVNFVNFTQIWQNWPNCQKYMRKGVWEEDWRSETHSNFTELTKLTSWKIKGKFVNLVKSERSGLFQFLFFDLDCNFVNFGKTYFFQISIHSDFTEIKNLTKLLWIASIGFICQIQGVLTLQPFLLSNHIWNFVTSVKFFNFVKDNLEWK